MLAIRKILKNANTDSPALNEFAQLVAETMPQGDIKPMELAGHVLETGRKAGFRSKGYTALAQYFEDGGDMCKLSAQILYVLKNGIPKTKHSGVTRPKVADFVTEYERASKTYFGECQFIAP